VAKLLWTQKQDIGPAPRAGHAMVFDAANKVVLLFGGLAAGNQPLNDTWSWDGQDWTELQDIGPPARFVHAMAYDSARQRTVLFGGASPIQPLGDTWEWDGESWTQMQDTGPSARAEHGMVFDAARARVVLFGGSTGAASQSDTWVWDGSDWSQVEDTGPSARRGHAMAYDGVRSRTVLFGGVGDAGGQAAPTLGDTWEWDGTVWKHVQDIGPAPATGAAMVFRSATSALFGGLSALASVPGHKLFGLTWEWNGHLWTARQDIGVGARFDHAMAFDSVRGRVVLFGGHSEPADSDAGLRGDTWEHVDTGGPPQLPGPGSVVPVDSVSLAPNPISPGQTLTITVQLQSPAPAGGSTVDIAIGGQSLGRSTVAAGAASVAVQLVVPDNVPHVDLPMTVDVTATGAGVTKSASLTIGLLP
jgi:Galactose oxidase, central domain/Kelch motif